jgi:aryl-alcohol dehydrogenase-like predicted oxidoreductase
VQKRHYREEIELSAIGFGGMVLVGMEQVEADSIVTESIRGGINYFDVAPFYGDGEAEEKLGAALSSRRGGIFLACKTLERTAEGAAAELERSLRRLRSDHLDLYQFHAVTGQADVDAIFAPGGAMEAFLSARRSGKVRFLGFSAHSVPAALSMLDRFAFDSILFPVNFVCYAKGNFGPQVLRKARERGAASIALKALALGPRRKGENAAYPNCWYRPIDNRELANLALRFSLSEDVTAAIPPGDQSLFRLVLEMTADLTPLTPAERTRLMAIAEKNQPLLSYSGITPSA